MFFENSGFGFTEKAFKKSKTNIFFVTDINSPVDFQQDLETVGWFQSRKNNKYFD